MENGFNLLLEMLSADELYQLTHHLFATISQKELRSRRRTPAVRWSEKLQQLDAIADEAARRAAEAACHGESGERVYQLMSLIHREIEAFLSPRKSTNTPSQSI